MRTEKTISTNRTNIKATTVFVIAVVALLYCPFFNMRMIIEGYIGDAMIQIRTGLDMLSSHSLITEEIYSWHPGLNWVPHEEAWYFLVGLFYKIGGVAGVILLTAVFNYTIAGLIFRKNLQNNVNVYILVITAAVSRYLSFPNYNARPHLVSQLLFVILVYTMMDEKVSALKKIITFASFTFLLGWFHGGMIPMFFVIYLVFIVIELIYRNFKQAGLYALGFVAGIITSVINPTGIKVWTYGLVLSGGEDIRLAIEEWAPKTFSVVEITLLLMFLAGFSVDKRLRDFDKGVVTKFCFLCMFIIMSCKYCRSMNFTALIVLMFCAEELQILLNWINDNTFKFDVSKLKLGDVSNYIIVSFCIVFMLGMSVYSWTSFFPTNKLSDISTLAAYDEGVISVLKEKQYERIYNSFDTGSWLAYYGIPVHIDNRVDPYMMEFSGVDHIRGKMNIVDIDAMDSFVSEYDADAIVLNLFPGTTDMVFADDLYSSDRYNIIYDNTVVSPYDNSISFRWIVAECVD